MLAYRNDVTGTTRTSSTTVTNGVWHELQVHVTIAGASSLVETWYDGAVIGALTRTDSLGTNPIGRLQLGDNDPSAGLLVSVTVIAEQCGTGFAWRSSTVTFEVKVLDAGRCTDPLAHEGVEQEKTSRSEAPAATVSGAAPVRVPSVTVRVVVSASTSVTDAVPTPAEKLTVPG